jgi:DNA (cytosine-5)-methyltransferase 1
MTVGSLFSGIGGFDLGLERAGMTVKWQVERDPWCQKVLAKHWPDVPRYENVEDVGGELECVDLICGGFPCQPVSVAGQQKGADDDRWLWPEFKRIVGLLGPRYVLVENVPGLFAANGGHAFGEVIGDLAELGYDCEWTVLSAADVGAPHLRKRVWIVAHTYEAPTRGNDLELDGPTGAGEGEGQKRQRVRRSARHGRQNVAHATSTGQHQQPDAADGFNQEQRPPKATPTGGQFLPRHGGGQAYMANANGRGCEVEREPEPPGIESARRRIFNGRRHVWDIDDATQDSDARRQLLEGRIRESAARATQWSVEPDVGRVAHGVPLRVDRLRGLGNAIVPQCAEWIGRQLLR